MDCVRSPAQDGLDERCDEGLRFRPNRFCVFSSPVVEYGYADGSTNTIRMTSVTYPDGRVLDYNYGTSGSATYRLDRVAGIDESGISFQLVSYVYTGSGMLVSQTYNEPGISKTLALGSGSNPYSRWTGLAG